jgi:hypothetical protein
MNTKFPALVSTVVLLGVLALTHPAHAKTIRIDGHPPGTVKEGCRGTFFAPSEQGVYGCLNKDGSGIVCGGTGDDYANTCDTWGKTAADARTPARTTLPSREEIKGHVDNPKPYPDGWPTSDQSPPNGCPVSGAKRQKLVPLCRRLE